MWHWHGREKGATLLEDTRRLVVICYYFVNKIQKNRSIKCHCDKVLELAKDVSILCFAVCLASNNVPERVFRLVGEVHKFGIGGNYKL